MANTKTEPKKPDEKKAADFKGAAEAAKNDQPHHEATNFDRPALQTNQTERSHDKATGEELRNTVATDPGTPSAIGPGEQPDHITSQDASASRGDPSKPQVQPLMQPPVTKLGDHDVAPRRVERNTVAGGLGPSAHHPNLRVRRAGSTGFENPGESRLVRVLRKSELNGTVFEAGAITYWPRGVEVLGPNLEEYTGQEEIHGDRFGD